MKTGFYAVMKYRTIVYSSGHLQQLCANIILCISAKTQDGFFTYYYPAFAELFISSGR